MQLLCILPFGMLCLSAISMMFVNYVGGYCGLSKLCPVGFPVVGESLLYDDSAC